MKAEQLSMRTQLSARMHDKLNIKFLWSMVNSGFDERKRKQIHPNTKKISETKMIIVVIR